MSNGHAGCVKILLKNAPLYGPDKVGLSPGGKKECLKMALSLEDGHEILGLLLRPFRNRKILHVLPVIVLKIIFKLPEPGLATAVKKNITPAIVAGHIFPNLVAQPAVTASGIDFFLNHWKISGHL